MKVFSFNFFGVAIKEHDGCPVESFLFLAKTKDMYMLNVLKKTEDCDILRGCLTFVVILISIDILCFKLIFIDNWYLLICVDIYWILLYNWLVVISSACCCQAQPDMIKSMAHWE